MGCDYLSDSPLSKSFFCFWTKNHFEFCHFALQNHLPPSSLPSNSEMDATPSQRPQPTAMSKFTQEIGF